MLAAALALTFGACTGTPGQYGSLTNDCGAPIDFILAEKYENAKDDLGEPTGPGDTDTLMVTVEGYVRDEDVAVRWAGDDSSVTFVTIPTDAWEPIEPGGDRDTDDVVATLSGDLCPDAP